MNDNVLLIGASGFVGTRLLETAIADFNIKNLDKQQSHFIQKSRRLVMFVINRHSTRR